MRYVSISMLNFISLREKQFIIFVNARCLEDEIWVKFWQNGELKTRPWAEYEAIGEAATTAVVTAQWSCQGLQILAQMMQHKEIDRYCAQTYLDLLASQALKGRFYVSRRPGRNKEERSQFD